MRPIILSGAAVIALTACADSTVSNHLNSVADQWSEAMAPLYITPVFPPREDVAVGDLWLVPLNLDSDTLVRMSAAGDTSTRLLYTNLGQIDVHEQLIDYYRSRPDWPQTTAGNVMNNPVGANEPPVWVEPSVASAAPFESVDPSVETPPAGFFRLRRVGFPDFLQARITVLQAQSSGLIGSALAFLGISGQFSESITVSIPSALSYGLPVPELFDEVTAVCNGDEPNVSTCRSGSRYITFHPDEINLTADNLAYSLPPALWENIAAASGPPRFRVVTLAEVYYAQAFDISISDLQAGGLSGGAETAIVDLRSLCSPQQPPESGAPVPAPPPECDTRVTGVTGTVETTDLAATLNRINGALAQDATAMPSGSLSVLSGSTEGLTLKRVYDRPVAIGYRALEMVVEVRNDGNGEYLALLPATPSRLNPPLNIRD